MVELLGLSGWVDELEAAARDVAEVLLHEGGWVAPPTVHVLCDELPELPYVASVRARPFARGADTATAVTGLGVFPALLAAPRVVVVWEQQDLAVALERAGRFPTGLVILDAHRAGGHVVRWRPMTIRDTGQTTAEGWPVAEARWQPSEAATVPDGRLPDPVTDLLRVWREAPECTPRDVVGGYTAMLQRGYEVHWIPRPRGEPLAGGPLWRRVLDPIMQ